MVNPKPPLRARRRQRGAVAVLVGLVLTTLVLMVGLVIDLGRLYVMKTELQNAADACALSAARELNDRGTGATARTRAAGVTVGNLNRANLQADAVAIQPQDIRFSVTLNEEPGEDVTASTVYVHCHAHRSNPMRLAMLFMTLAGIQDRELSALAVARTVGGQSFYGIPLAVCTAQPEAPNHGFSAGNWYSGLMGSGAGETGNYGWLQFGDPGGEELANILAGPGLTGALPQTVESASTSGFKGGLVEQAWNTRFGLYSGSFKDGIDQFPPDRTGYAYTPDRTVENGSKTTTIAGSWPAASSAYGDYVQRKNLTHDPYNPEAMLDKNGKPEQLPGNPQPLSTEPEDIHGIKGQDRRVVLAPVIRCDQWTQKTIPVLDWACMLLLTPIADTSGVQLEFLGLSGQSPCASTGFPGGLGPPVPALVR